MERRIRDGYKPESSSPPPRLGPQSAVDDEEDFEVDEPEPELEQDAVAPFAEEDRPKLDDGFHEIEAIRKKRVVKGEPHYFIKWRGWPESSNTWEPLEHLDTCPDVVEAFEKSLNSGKKMLQKSCANNGSRDERSSRVEKRAFESGPSYDPSCTSGSKETAGNDNSVDKDNAQKDITIQLEEAGKDDTSTVNSSSKIDSGSADANQSERRIGAKRRKSGIVQRFRPDHSSFDPRLARNFVLVNGTYNRDEHQTNDVQDVSITFLVMRYPV